MIRRLVLPRRIPADYVGRFVRVDRIGLDVWIDQHADRARIARSSEAFWGRRRSLGTASEPAGPSPAGEVGPWEIEPTTRGLRVRPPPVPPRTGQDQ